MSQDFMEDLDRENRESVDDYLAKIRREAYRYYEKVTITAVNGDCPYGHCEGDTFSVTNMNADSMCGSLYQVIHPCVTTLHYGGALCWESSPDAYTTGVCPEGRVHVQVKRIELPTPKALRTENRIVDMTGKGYAGIDKYRITLETISVANKCTWGHTPDQRLELDCFNIGGVCGFMYWEIYQYVNVLLAGGSMAWESEPDIIHGCCPDPFNQVTYRLIREER
ncbi:MAG: TIGR04076 family protein [Deltaproteobacteria bacterium]|nr:TIGR04076 family protein [Deltaproteobacteria bacterium]